MTAKILAALAKLDPANNDHWTEDGSPRMEVMKSLTSDFALTRAAVTEASPGFSRASVGAPAAQTAPAQAPAAPGNAPADVAATPVAPVLPEAAAAVPAVVSQESKDELDDAVGTGDETQSQGQEADGEFEAAQARLVEARERKIQADEEYSQANAEVDRLIEARSTVTGSDPLHEVLSGYQAQQQKNRDIRRQQIDRLKGIDIRALLPARAPIDQAMARKTGRGTQRPTKV